MTTTAPFELTSSAWQVIKSVAPPSEIEEIIYIIGGSLVEQVIELRQEAENLLEIWRDFRQEIDNISVRNKAGFLPEPPELRNRLKQEIIMLVDILRQKDKAQKQGILQDYEHIVNYVAQPTVLSKENRASPLSRPQSACSSLDNREVPVARSSGSGRSSATNSMLDDEVKSISNQVNIIDIDAIALDLRNLLEEEYENLKSDIEYLQSCLEDESNFQHQINSETTEPSLSELRKFGTQLERTILSSVGKPPIPDKLPKGSESLSKVVGKPRRLQSIDKMKTAACADIDSLNKLESVKLTASNKDGNTNESAKAIPNKMPSKMVPRPPPNRPKTTVKANSAGSRRKLAVYFNPENNDKTTQNDCNQTDVVDPLKFNQSKTSPITSRVRQYSA